MKREPHNPTRPTPAREYSKTKSTKKKKKKWPIVLLIIALMLLILAIGAFIVFRYLTGGLTSTKLDKEELGIEAENDPDNGADISRASVVNIALFGVDTRDESAGIGDRGRSDTIIIMSVNKNDNSIRMTSILRDSKVPIEGYAPQKINAAYKYGGATLAIKTLNQNFKLDIEDYITVDFGALEEIIDIIGGVDVYLTAEEAEYVNEYADTAMGYEGYDAQEGMNTLNGAQAVSYSRIRSIDSDYYRAGRQQIVLGAVFEKLSATPKTQYPVMIHNLMGCVETSLEYTELLTLVGSIDTSSASLESNTVPDYDYEEDLWGGIDDTGSWVWIYDLDAAADRIHEIIYNEQK